MDPSQPKIESESTWNGALDRWGSDIFMLLGIDGILTMAEVSEMEKPLEDQWEVRSASEVAMYAGGPRAF